MQVVRIECIADQPQTLAACKNMRIFGSYAPFLFKPSDTLKEIIDNFINQNTKIADFIDATSEQYQDGKDVLPAFTEKLTQTQFNAALGNSFVDLLQLSNDERTYTQYSLEDVSRLYGSLIRLQPSNLENYVDAAYFEHSIQDNNEKAHAIVNAGLEKIGQIQEELMRLLQTMQEAD